MNTQVKLFVLIGLLISFSGVAQGLTESWSVSINESNLYDGKSISLSKISSNSVRNESDSKDVYPSIDFYCQNNNPEIFLKIDWKRFVSSFNKSEIGITIDNARTEWISVKIDKKNEITRLTSTKDTQKIINKLSTATSLRVEVEPYSEPVIFSEYNLADFPSKLNEFIQICKK